MSNQQKQVKYGELALVGYNGRLPRGNHGRVKSKLILLKQENSTGIKLSRCSVTKIPYKNNNDSSHSITYIMPNTTAIVAEYEEDKSTDMFQIGRSSESSIDFVVWDSTKRKENSEPCTSVSRFACRIAVDRQKPEIARIFAAGFNDSKKIILGKQALKWIKEDDTMDGLTSNGVLIAQPLGEFSGGEGQYDFWREVSVRGDIYSLRENRNSRQMGKLIEEENNILKDGTLISLCGATLVWRSFEGLAKTPDKLDVEELVNTIKDGLPGNLSVGADIIIPRKLTSSPYEVRPHVFTRCGHVCSVSQSDLEKIEENKCIVCSDLGLVSKLCMGLEPAFYVDYGPPMYAFIPCGHMATEKTVKFWSSVEIPHGVNEFIAMCPFCAVPLEGYPGYIKLVFSTEDNV